MKRKLIKYPSKEAPNPCSSQDSSREQSSNGGSSIQSNTHLDKQTEREEYLRRNPKSQIAYGVESPRLSPFS